MSLIRLSIFVVYGLAAVASAQATKPSGHTQRDLCRTGVATFRTTLLRGYDANGTHPSKWDADARTFLDRMAVRLGEARFDPTDRAHADASGERTLALAEKLKGCDHPLVNYCRFMAYRTANWTDVSLRLLADNGPAVVDGDYAAYWRYFAAADLARAFPQEPKWAQRRDALLSALLTEKQVDPLNRQNLVFLVRNNIWNVTGHHRERETPPAERQALLDTLAAAPDMDPWLLDVLRGRHEIALAWAARGGGWANTVTAKGWAGFYEHIAAARRVFEAAHARQPDYPDAAAGMITVCMAEGTDARVWFDRAVAAGVDALFAWDMYNETLRPRWGGSVRSMVALGMEAARTRRYDTETPLYLRFILYDIMRNESVDRAALLRVPGLWPEVAAMFDGYLSGSTPGADVPLLASERAAFAWAFGAYDEALSGLTKLGDAVRPAAFDRFGVGVADVREECAARTGPNADAVKAIDALEADGKFADAAAGYAAVVKTLADADPARRFCARRKVLNGIFAAAAAGGPAEVPLTDADALSAFRGDTGAWKAENDALVYAGKPNTAGTLIHAVPLPSRGRLRVEWSWTTADPRHAPWMDLIFRDSKAEGLIYARASALQGRMGVHMGPYDFNGVKQPAPMPAGEWHTLLIDYDGESLTVRNDGVSVFDMAHEPWLTRGRPVLGFTAHNASVDSAIRIRKLVIEPPPGP